MAHGLVGTKKKRIEVEKGRATHATNIRFVELWMDGLLHGPPKRQRGRPGPWKPGLGRWNPPKSSETIVQRPQNRGAPLKAGLPVAEEEEWDGRFQSVEPLKHQKKKTSDSFKWNHPRTLNWIMGQVNPLGFLTAVMRGDEIFNVYTKTATGMAIPAGKISADPELRVMAAKTLLGKCVPDLKAVEVHAQVEQTKTLDIGRLNDDDLNTIELALQHALIDDPDTSESGEDEALAEGVHQGLLADDRTGA